MGGASAQMAGGNGENVLGRIVDALKVVHSPYSPNQSRREAQSFLEEVKALPEAPSQRTGGADSSDNAGGQSWKPVETSLEDELKEAGDEATRALREKQRQMIDALDLSK